MNPLHIFSIRYAGATALGLFAVSGAGFAAAIDGYSHALHPLAVLGAQGIPRAGLFNLLAFAVPGLLVAVVAWRLRTALPGYAPWPARIGAQLLLLSALAFAAQGALPLDIQQMDGAASKRHAAVWMLWWIACSAGGALLATGLRRMPWILPATATAVMAAAVPMFALLAPQWLPAGLAQRIAFATWFAWAMFAGIAAGAAISRAAASGRGSSATNPT